jgi:hypothetical protein
VNWAATEGWNPGLADDACFAAVDPEGFLIGELDGAPATLDEWDARVSASYLLARPKALRVLAGLSH